MDSSSQNGQPHNIGDASIQNVPQICQLCHEQIADVVINCNRCQKPYHTNCAKVSSPQASWLCPTCNPKSTYSLHTASSTHSSITSKDSVSRNKALELQKLEEERELSLRRDHEYLSKKYQILHEIDEANTDQQPNTVPSQIIEASNTVENPPNLTSLNTSIHLPVTSNIIPIMSTTVTNPNRNHTYNSNNLTGYQQSKFHFHKTQIQHNSHKHLLIRDRQKCFSKALSSPYIQDIDLELTNYMLVKLFPKIYHPFQAAQRSGHCSVRPTIGLQPFAV